MTLDELQAQLMIDVETSTEEERLLAYEVRIEIPNVASGEDGWTVEGVRWDHQNGEVILEIGDA